MERSEEQDHFIEVDDRVDRQGPVLSSNLFLEHVGEVILHIDADGLSWELLEPTTPKDRSVCFGIKPVAQVANEIKFAEIYAVELIENGSNHKKSDVSGPIKHPAKHLLGHDSQMYQFSVHFAKRSKSQPSLLSAAVLTFGHKDLQACQMWANNITLFFNKEVDDRPKNLLIFVHPMSGKGNGCRTWEAVAPIFVRAKVQTKVIVTEKAGHAFDVMRTTAHEELKLYDGVVSIGGDGFFNEVLNGLLSTHYKASYPPMPADFLQSLGENKNIFLSSTDEPATDSYQNEDQFPLIPDSELGCSGVNVSDSVTDDNVVSFLPNERFRFGIIPAGSTDAIVICTTGARDPTTSALHIVLGKRLPLDIGQIVRWKATSTSKVEPCVRYAASFAGYGFYGDVVTESEKYRWMGPKRYDYVGTKVFMRHRSYEAEVSFAETKPEEPLTPPDNGEAANHGGVKSPKLWSLKKPRRSICRVNCSVCKSSKCTPFSLPTCRDLTWKKSKGRFISIGAAIMSNRNERAPDGLVADAHLADGFLHLILVNNCPRPFYLWHLLQLAKKDGHPLDFDFVDHHKTRAFTFQSCGTSSSVWNIDGEAFHAHQLSAQVFRGLISLFASGPEM